MRRTLLVLFFLAVGFAVGAGWLALNASAQRAISEPEIDEFEQRVHDYLLENRK